MFLLANGAETWALIFLGHYTEALKHHSGNEYDRLLVAVFLNSTFHQALQGQRHKTMCATAVNGCWP